MNENWKMHMTKCYAVYDLDLGEGHLLQRRFKNVSVNGTFGKHLFPTLSRIVIRLVLECSL